MMTMTGAEDKIRGLMQEEPDTVGLFRQRGRGVMGTSMGVHWIEDERGRHGHWEGRRQDYYGPQSTPLLNGVEVDYVNTVQGWGFAIKNPKAKTTCGCGSSFSSWPASH